MLKKLIAILRQKSYALYDKPFQLNIVGIRSAQNTANRFDDELHVFYRDANYNWKHYNYRITTDPGTYWLINPLQVDGTAILKEGQYKSAYRLGLHKGQYKALVQNKPVTVIRDYDRDAYLDWMNGKESAGFFGINIHRAKAQGETTKVDKWSAGCQVFENALDFSHFLALCEKHKIYYSNQFTYTLIDYRSVNRMNRRWWLYGLTGTLAVGGILYYLFND